MTTRQCLVLAREIWMPFSGGKRTFDLPNHVQKVTAIHQDVERFKRWSFGLVGWWRNNANFQAESVHDTLPQDASKK